MSRSSQFRVFTFIESVSDRDLPQTDAVNTLITTAINTGNTYK